MLMTSRYEMHELLQNNINVVNKHSFYETMIGEKWNVCGIEKSTGNFTNKYKF
ncbi:hypothetical protein HNQ90_001825 [Algibacter amylolyticus]|nr:hypothetical protein [Algibacter amylolyticus]